jgi:hypothetical protein
VEKSKNYDTKISKNNIDIETGNAKIKLRFGCG